MGALPPACYPPWTSAERDWFIEAVDSALIFIDDPEMTWKEALVRHGPTCDTKLKQSHLYLGCH
jgi:hypothetical protein